MFVFEPYHLSNDLTALSNAEKSQRLIRVIIYRDLAKIPGCEFCNVDHTEVRRRRYTRSRAEEGNRAVRPPPGRYELIDVTEMGSQCVTYGSAKPVRDKV